MDKKVDIDKETDLSIMRMAYVAASKRFFTPAFNKQITYGGKSFKYADLQSIYDATKEFLLEEGLFPMHETVIIDGLFYIKTYVQHINGCILGNFMMPMNFAGMKIQEIGSQMTYNKRYSLLAILCIVGDEDNDAKEIEDKKLNDKIDLAQAKEIGALTGGKKEIWQEVVKKFNVTKIVEIPKEKFELIKKFLKAKKEELDDA